MTSTLSNPRISHKRPIGFRVVRIMQIGLAFLTLKHQDLSHYPYQHWRRQRRRRRHLPLQRGVRFLHLRHPLGFFESTSFPRLSFSSLSYFCLPFISAPSSSRSISSPSAPLLSFRLLSSLDILAITVILSCTVLYDFC